MNILGIKNNSLCNCGSVLLSEMYVKIVIVKIHTTYNVCVSLFGYVQINLRE